MPPYRHSRASGNPVGAGFKPAPTITLDSGSPPPFAGVGRNDV